MSKILLTVLSFSLCISCAAASAADPPTGNPGAPGSASTLPYERAVLDIVEGASLMSSKLAHFCVTQEGTENILQSFDLYLRNMAAGTRAGLIAVRAPDTQQGTLTAEGKAVAARTGETVLQAAKSNPRAACKNLQAEFESGTAIKFENQVTEQMQQYRKRRQAYCARQPRPGNCTTDE